MNRYHLCHAVKDICVPINRKSCYWPSQAQVNRASNHFRTPMYKYPQ